MKFSHIIKNVVSSFVLRPCSPCQHQPNVVMWTYSWGSRRTGRDARLCGDDDAVCAVSDIRCCCRDGDNIRFADIHQDEHRGRWSHQVHTDADRSLSVYDRRIHPGSRHSLATRFKTQLQKSISCESDNTFRV